MGDQRDRAVRERITFDVPEGPQPVGDVDEAHAPCAAERHAGATCLSGQAVPERLRAGAVERAGEDDG